MRINENKVTFSSLINIQFCQLIILLYIKGTYFGENLFWRIWRI